MRLNRASRSCGFFDVDCRTETPAPPKRRVHYNKPISLVQVAKGNGEAYEVHFKLQPMLCLAKQTRWYGWKWAVSRSGLVGSIRELTLVPEFSYMRQHYDFRFPHGSNIYLVKGTSLDRTWLIFSSKERDHFYASNLRSKHELGLAVFSRTPKIEDIPSKTQRRYLARNVITHVLPLHTDHVHVEIHESQCCELV